MLWSRESRRQHYPRRGSLGYLVEDYDRIRNDIEAVLPEFADYNQRIRHPGGFHLINAAAERRWMTPSGKANFITSKGLLEDPSSAFNSKLVMATVRSHDQYNTTIYGMDDRYRGYSVNEMWSL